MLDEITTQPMTDDQLDGVLIGFFLALFLGLCLALALWVGDWTGGPGKGVRPITPATYHGPVAATPVAQR